MINNVRRYGDRHLHMSDPRPLIFFRQSFAALMLVYSAGRCTDFAFEVQDIEAYSNVLNQPFAISATRCPFPLNLLRIAVNGYPWLSTGSDEMYWRGLHAPLLLLCAGGMLFSSGILSRIFFVCFAFLKLVVIFRNIMVYNNHEYLYATLALLFAVLDGFDSKYNLCIRVHKIITFGSVWKILILALGSLGLVYMMLCSALFGIANHVAVVGMCSVWLAIGAILSEDGRNGKFPTKLIPTWNIWIVQAVLCSVYFFAALAKMDSDWLSGNTARQLLTYWSGLGVSNFVNVLVSKECLSPLETMGVCNNAASQIDLDFWVINAVM